MTLELTLKTLLKVAHLQIFTDYLLNIYHVLVLFSAFGIAMSRTDPFL